MRSVWAQLIFTGDGPAINRGRILLTVDGEIASVQEDVLPEEGDLILDGCICPGFVNAHCHLELSALEGRIGEGTGLNSFVDELSKIRPSVTKEEIDSAMRHYDQAMWLSGISAVGDICNTADTFELKKLSPVRYYSFIERFAFNPSRATETFENGEQILKLLKSGSDSEGNMTVHAPYSASPELLKRLADHVLKEDGIFSIHMQESPSEDEFFLKGTGEMAARLAAMGIPLSHWVPPGKSSMKYILESLPPGLRLLFVHNTFTKQSDLEACRNYRGEVWFCLCPSANRYIERSLPDVGLIRENTGRIVIGTDSIASNWQLDMLEELKLIQEAFPEIPCEELIRWSGSNAAQLFRYNDLGDIRVGKRPGLVQITGFNIEARVLTGKSLAKRVCFD